MVRELSAFKQAHAFCLREKGEGSFREIAKKCGMSKSSAHRIWKRNMSLREGHKGRKEDGIIKRKPGPHPRLSARDKRVLLRTLENMRKTNCNITVMGLVAQAGLDPTLMHRRTYTKYLNGMGFNFLQARKKGLLSDKDKKIRLKHARSMKNVLKSYPDFYTKHIAFYLDGVSFIHKFNPMKDACRTRARVWRRRGEGLKLTAKGSKELAGGRRLHLIVAVAHGKGIILKEDYEKNDS